MPVAPVKKPDGVPPSSDPGMTPDFRSRVRSTRHGSTALVRISFVNFPSGAMLIAAAGACRYGFLREIPPVVHHEMDRLTVTADERSQVPVVETHAMLTAAARRGDRHRTARAKDAVPAR